MGKKGVPHPPAPPTFRNNPFAGLKAKMVTPAPVEKPVAKPAPPPPPPPEIVDDERLFADEMASVAKLTNDPRGRLGAPEPSTLPIVKRRSEEAEAYAQLADLVDGVGPFDISDSDEFIEGLGPGVDRRLLRKLRRGDYSVHTHIDLHGLTSDDAHDEVNRFVDAARRDSKRCVLIVHGRGMHSKEGIPVLKERLKVWLTRGRVGRAVLAFATARPSDGGAGAVYVLLRR